MSSEGLVVGGACGRRGLVGGGACGIYQVKTTFVTQGLHLRVRLYICDMVYIENNMLIPFCPHRR